jgi:hypothetical protein
MVTKKITITLNTKNPFDSLLLASTELAVGNGASILKLLAVRGLSLSPDFNAAFGHAVTIFSEARHASFRVGEKTYGRFVYGTQEVAVEPNNTTHVAEAVVATTPPLPTSPPAPQTEQIEPLPPIIPLEYR